MEEESQQQFDIQKRADELANAFSWEGLDKSCAAVKKFHLKKWLTDVVLQGNDMEMKSYLEMHTRELKDAEEWATMFDLEDMTVISTLYRMEKQMEMIKDLIYKNKVMKRISEYPPESPYHFECQTTGSRWYFADGDHVKNIMVQDMHWSKEAHKGEITISIYNKDLFDKAVDHVGKLHP